MTKLKKSFAWLPTRERLSIVPPYAWLILTLLVPFLIVLKISFAESIFGQPPYSQLLEYKDGVLRIALYLESYITLFSDSLLLMRIYDRSEWPL